MKPATLFLLIGAGILITGGGVVAAYGATRGLRNNNPGNIRRGITWKGMAAVQTDKEYIVFETPAYGIRAMGRVLDTYKNRYGLNTIRGIIERWAPASENDTASYVAHVARVVGVGPDAQLTAAHRPLLVAAIVKHENGVQPYPLELIKHGLSLA